ncbi:MAG TPA: DUF899 domain-containing protein, partial [Fimbriimonas sp.]|nr:DUF899 domain-containing protein [Fimbriimonas sp.]
MHNEAHPPIATREEWLKHRLELLAEEKAHTREYDRINAKRRRLPMVPVEKAYTFQTVDGDKTLLELFGDNQQLIVYHFMFGPDWKKGCEGCTSLVDAFGDFSSLATKGVGFVCVSRAPLEKLQAYKVERGWNIDWVSSGESEFNYDFHVTLDPAKGSTTYNYKEVENGEPDDERPGTSVFFRIGEKIYHTYSCFARGGESLTHTYALLDITPFGRQEDFEDSPAGWPQKPT